MKYDIFVSYRRSDRELIAQMVLRLEARGVAVWYDAKLEGGDDWREAIVDSLTNSDMLVIFFSDDCNNSRQLKKELAVADSLGKPVVPVLIEDTRPRGAFLYELADRNWIQAWPNPMGKIDELVDHLTLLAGKSEGGLEGRTTSPVAMPSKKLSQMGAPEPAPETASSEPVDPEPADLETAAPPPAAPPPSAPPPAAAAPADDLFASRKSASSPQLRDAYIGKKHPGAASTARLHDILPFRWVDLVFLGPAVGALVWYLKQDGLFVDANPLYEPLGLGMMAMTLIGLYGALVFPVRYYLRRRPVWHALGRYLISSVILYVVVVGTFVAAWSYGVFPYDHPAEFAPAFGVIWLVFTVIAFLIYALLAAQRAIRSFRSNIKKI